MSTPKSVRVANTALLRTLSEYFSELTCERAYQMRKGYDPKRWSRWSQQWNRRQAAWRADQGLFMRRPGMRDDRAVAGITAAALSLFDFWKATHLVLDYERTRPSRLAMFARLQHHLRGVADILHTRMDQAEQQYNDLFAIVQEEILAVNGA